MGHLIVLSVKKGDCKSYSDWVTGEESGKFQVIIAVVIAAHMYVCPTTKLYSF